MQRDAAECPDYNSLHMSLLDKLFVLCQYALSLPMPSNDKAQAMVLVMSINASPCIDTLDQMRVRGVETLMY